MEEPARNAKQVVTTFLESMNAEDFKAARTCVTDSLSFVGVLGTRDGKEAYFKDMEQMKAKYDIKKMFVDGNDVCVLYDISFGNSPASIFTCGWYQVQGGKIGSIRVVFDPRPRSSSKNKRQPPLPAACGDQPALPATGHLRSIQACLLLLLHQITAMESKYGPYIEHYYIAHAYTLPCQRATFTTARQRKRP